jgi:hypothetical protein
VRFTAKRLENDYVGSSFKIEEGGERYKVWATIKSVRGDGSISIEAKVGYSGLASVTVGLWNGTNLLDELKTTGKYPTPAMIDEFVDKALAGRSQMVEWMFGVSMEKVASEILRVAREFFAGYTSFDDLPVETQGDIIAAVEEKFQTDDVRDNLTGLVNPPVFLVLDMPLDRITGYNRKPSEVAVKKYVKMLEEGSEAPPILVDGNRFLDGGHRFAAYRAAGRKTIPTVDIGRLFMMWNEWVKGGADELQRESSELLRVASYLLADNDTDAEYLEAVERGNMGKVAELVALAEAHRMGFREKVIGDMSWTKTRKTTEGLKLISAKGGSVQVRAGGKTYSLPMIVREDDGSVIPLSKRFGP